MTVLDQRAQVLCEAPGREGVVGFGDPVGGPPAPVPRSPRTETAAMREAALCAREGVTINIFLPPSWLQTREDIHFAYRMAESTRGRVFFTSGNDLDRYALWDYLQRRRTIIT